VAFLLLRVGKYEIVRRLGHGSRGAIYLARDPSVPLADPRTLPPPHELQQKHFGGTLFLLQRCEKLVKRQPQA
jgi:hypothetical protein